LPGSGSAELEAPASAQRIVVGFDGSEAAEKALNWAIGEAERSGSILDIVTAWMFPMALGYAFTTTVHEVQAAAQGVVDRAITHAAEQPPAPALVAAGNGADLLVVGSRGLGGFNGLLLGSVSQYCARNAVCSVVVVH